MSITVPKIKKGLFVGINYRNTPNELYGCVNDVVHFRNAICDAYCYELKNVVVLRDDSTIPELQPTRENILNQLRTLVAGSAQCEEIFFHYSGHGSRVIDRDGDEKYNGGYDSVIVPVNYSTAGLITDDELLSIIKNARCRFILVFDSCNSSSICDLKYQIDYVSPTQFSISSNPLRPVLENKQIYCLSGCHEQGFSADTFSDDQKQAVGAFTDALISMIRANNYTIPLIYLYRSVCMYLKETGYEQIPVLSCSGPTPNYILSRPEYKIPQTIPVKNPQQIISSYMNDLIHRGMK